MTEPTQELISAAQATQAKWQIPASLSLSACGVESAFFTKMPKGSLNGFGIKALPGQPQVDARTGEQTTAGASYTITAGFRVFASIADAFDAYGRLLGLGKPYHDMVTKFLASPRVPADVQALSNALTGVYASARNYGSALIAVQKQFNLYQYDKETPVPETSTSPAPLTPHIAIVPDVVAPTPVTPRVVPTISQPVRVGWGAWGEQFLVHETKMIETAANSGLVLAENALPFGWAIKMFVGQQTVDELIDQGLKVLEGDLHGQAITVSGDHPLFVYVANMIETTLPNLFAALGPKLDDLIKEGLAKVGIAV